jgi:hypothetical protein
LWIGKKPTEDVDMADLELLLSLIGGLGRWNAETQSYEKDEDCVGKPPAN